MTTQDETAEKSSTCLAAADKPASNAPKNSPSRRNVLFAGSSLAAASAIAGGRVQPTQAQAQQLLRRHRARSPISAGQPQSSGTAVTPGNLSSASFVASIRLDDAGAAQVLPAGSAGSGAIYTDHVKVSHVIPQVILRQIAIMNYVNPF